MELTTKKARGYIMSTDIKELPKNTKEKSELCILNKKEKASGELLAVVEMPKSRTKQVAKAVLKNDKLRPGLCGVYMDNSGYIVATNGYVINVCKITGVFADAFNGAILPAEFAKRADGCTVEINKDGDTVTAYCGEENEECINVRYPSWRAAMDSWGKICEKGHVKVKYADVKKAVGKDDAVTLSTYDGGVTISTYNQHNDPGVIYRHIQVEAEHGIDEFAISIDTENLKKVMPCCNDMYVADNKRPLYFIGDGCLSLVMPLDNENISHCDITRGETLVSAFDIMNGVTVCNESSKKDIAAEVVATEQPKTDAATTDTDKEPDKQTETNESVIATTPTETTDTANVSGEGEKEAERAENDQNPTAADIAQMVKTELAKNKAMRTVWHLEFPDGDECLVRYNYTLPEPYGDQYIYEEARDGHVFFSITCGWENIPSWICLKLGIEPPQSPETPQTVEHTTDTEKQTQSVCEHLATPNRQHPKHLQHSGLLRRKTFRRLRVRRCSSVSRVVGGINGENAAERKETGKFPRWHICKYRQFTRGSTPVQGMNVRTGGTNEIINKQYPGEMFCRGA